MSHWSYSLWLESIRTKIKYSKDKNFKDGLIQELTNSPNDIEHSGRGMRLVDHSNEVEILSDDELLMIEETKCAIEESKASADQIKYKLWMDIKNGVVDEEEQFNPTIAYEKLKNGDTISDISTIKLDMYRLKTANPLINFDDLEKLPTGNIDLFTKIIGNSHEAKIERRNWWLNKYDLENIQKKLNLSYWQDRKFNGKKRLKFAQTYEDQREKGINGMRGLKELFKLLNIDFYGQELVGKIVTRKSLLELKNNKTKLFEFYDVLLKYFKNIISDLNGSTEPFQLIQNAFKHWYNNPENDGKHIYDCSRDDFLVKYNITSHGKVNDLKKSFWVQNSARGENSKKAFDDKCKAGKWNCSMWKKLRPETWTILIIKNMLIKIISSLLGYNFEEYSGHKLMEEYVFVDDLSYLKPVSDNLLIFPKL